MKNKMIGRASTILLAASLSASLLAATFDTAQLNKKMKDAGSNMSVLSATEVWEGTFFVGIGNKETGVYTNLILSEKQDIGFSVSGSAIFDSDAAEKAKEINDVVQKNQLSIVDHTVSNIPEGAKLYFNGAEMAKKDVTVVVVDPKCPHCKNELESEIKKLYEAGKPVIVISIGMLSEESLKTSATLVEKKKEIGNDFSKMLAIFNGDGQTTASEESLAIANEVSQKLLSLEPIAAGVPYKYTRQ